VHCLGIYRCLVAARIDILQGEQQCSMGYVLPTITFLKKKLVKPNAKHAKPLCDALSNNFLFATTRAHLQALQWRDCLVQLHSYWQNGEINSVTNCLKKLAKLKVNQHYWWLKDKLTDSERWTDVRCLMTLTDVCDFSLLANRSTDWLDC